MPLPLGALPQPRRRAGNGSIATAPAPPPAAAPPLLIRGLRPPRLRAGRFSRPLRARGDRHDPGQTTRSAPAAGLLAWAGVHLLDPLFEFSQPLLHRALDLRARCPRFLGPGARPIRANGFWRGVGVGRLGLDRDLRREFRHLPKS
ncbi:MAG TPA: hypothetical protein VGR77_02780 [Candidatus Dormibacteraeota bacterium]|nr:hypothetical protein [Candidatus Dormibacteraeota bacterium]